jgi:hypothetical protein
MFGVAQNSPGQGGWLPYNRLTRLPHFRTTVVNRRFAQCERSGSQRARGGCTQGHEDLFDSWVGCATARFYPGEFFLSRIAE